MAPDFMTFDEVIEELQLDAAELKKMVSDEEIRAFRDGGQLKFKNDDIAALKERRETQPTIILPAEDVISQVEEAPVIAGIEEEPAEEAPIIAGIEEEPAEEAPIIAGIGEEPAEEAPIIAGIGEEPAEEAPIIGDLEEEPIEESAATVEVPSDEEEVAPTMAIEVPGIEEEPAETVEVSGISQNIDLVEETSAPLEQTMGIELPDDLEAATVAGEGEESATVIGEEDLVMAIKEEEEPVMEAEAEMEEEPLVHAVSLPPEMSVAVSTSPVFTVMFIISTLALIFAGMILVDLVREPAEMPVYLKSICEVVLGN